MPALRRWSSPCIGSRSMRNEVKSSRRSLWRSYLAVLFATKGAPRRERAETEINLRKGKSSNSRRLKVNCVLHIYIYIYTISILVGAWKSLLAPLRTYCNPPFLSIIFIPPDQKLRRSQLYPYSKYTERLIRSIPSFRGLIRLIDPINYAKQHS